MSTRLEGCSGTTYYPTGEAMSMLNGKRYIYIPLDTVSLEEALSHDVKHNTEYDYVEKLKGLRANMPKGIWVLVDSPNTLEKPEDEKETVFPQYLEEKISEISTENVSRLMTEAEALVLLEYIRQMEGKTVSDLCSIPGFDNQIIPYMTSRRNSLLVKTEEGYAILGAGSYYRDMIPITDIRKIDKTAYVSSGIMPIMVLEGVPVN